MAFLTKIQLSYGLCGWKENQLSSNKINIGKKMKMKANLPELDYETQFGLSENDKAGNDNRVTPKDPIEYLH